jgi:hypothetical protein
MLLPTKASLVPKDTSRGLIKDTVQAQGDVGQGGLLSAYTGAWAAGSDETQDDEVIDAFAGCRPSKVSFLCPIQSTTLSDWLPAGLHDRLQVIMLDGKDGAFRDAAPGWQPLEPGDQQQEAAEAAHQPEQAEQQQAEQQAAEGQNSRSSRHSRQQPWNSSTVWASDTTSGSLAHLQW